MEQKRGGGNKDFEKGVEQAGSMGKCLKKGGRVEPLRNYGLLQFSNFIFITFYPLNANSQTTYQISNELRILIE